MNNENKNPNVEEELKKQSQEAAENEQTTSEASEAQENASSEEKELTAEEKLGKELEEAQKVIDEQKDKYLRLSAEFDNFRKRTLKEKAELIKNGGEKAINAILPILDDLERALQNMQKAEDAIYEGEELTYQKYLKNLHQEGLEKMEPVGEAFDTDFHEAVALVPAPSEEQKGKVLDCVQTGYKLNEKVIRHAKVVVAQ